MSRTPEPKLEKGIRRDTPDRPSSSHIVRPFRVGDEMALRELHRDAILRMASADYDERQIAAWLSLSGDVEAWVAKMRRNRPLIAVWESQVAGYADVQQDGLIDHFFVSPQWKGRGVARALLEAILLRAGECHLETVHAFVSKTARSTFLHFGFVVVEECFPVVDGVRLQNAHMRRNVARSAGGGRHGR